jgi:S1-C subfamily serine protease
MKMKATSRAILVVFFIVLGISCGVGIARIFDSKLFQSTPARRPLEPPVALLNLQDSLAEAAKFVMKSVVHITTVFKPRTILDWWRLHERPLRSVASGVIVDSDGYVLTNYHVIAELKRGDEIYVMLHDNRHFKASIVGFDKLTDLAVLKIINPKDLVPAVLGDSDKVRVGDLVIAVGSPFGYHHTVTFGIISAKGRKAERTKYTDFLQTDAPINPGNSGGALSNIRGEVIGINTMIATGGAMLRPGNVGIGFAIPINLAKWVMDRLIKKGHVKRGYLGISGWHFDRELLERLKERGVSITMRKLLKELNLERPPKGVFVIEVVKNSPAHKAGIRVTDVIIEYNGEKIGDFYDLLFKVTKTTPGTWVKVKVLRNGQVKEFEVKISELERYYK